MARNCKVEPTANLIHRVLAKHKMVTDYSRALIFYRWPEIVGTEMAKQIIPQSLKFKTLYVYIKNPVWANNFQYVKQEVISKINQVIGKKLVEEIQFSRWKQKEAVVPAAKAAESDSYKQRLAEVEVEPSAAEAIAKKVARIRNEDLKEKLRGIMLTQYKRDKLREEDNWQSCACCGMSIPPGEELCFLCQLEEEQERELEMRAIFRIMPQIKFAQLRDYMDCTSEEYNRIKSETIQLWCSRLRPGIDYPDKKIEGGTDSYSLEAQMVTMLYRGITYEELNRSILASTMRRLKYNTAYWDTVNKQNRK